MMIDIEDFRNYVVKSFGLTKGTGEVYSSCVRQFFQWANKSPIEITTNDLIEFFQYLYNKNYNASTMITYLSALRTYYDYLIYKGITDRNVPREFKRRFRTPRKLPDVMTIDEMRIMIEMPFDYRYDEERAKKKVLL